MRFLTARPSGRRNQLKGRKHSPEQIIRKLREADRLLAEGKTNAEVAKALEVTEWTPASGRSGRRPR